MNAIKKYLGIIWIAAGPLLVAFMFWQAYEKVSVASEAAKTNTILQWIIILIVFIPVCIGLMIFGWYAWNNEYRDIETKNN